MLITSKYFAYLGIYILPVSIVFEFAFFDGIIVNQKLKTWAVQQLQFKTTLDE